MKALFGRIKVVQSQLTTALLELGETADVVMLDSLQVFEVGLVMVQHDDLSP